MRVFVFLFLFLNINSVFAQRKKNVTKMNDIILICGSNAEEFKNLEIKKCSELSVKGKDLKVVSFGYSLIVSGALIEATKKGNELLEHDSSSEDNEIVIFIDFVKLEDGTIFKGTRKVKIIPD